MNKPNIIFFGNTKYSTLGARIIHQKYPLYLVVTIPEKIVGRKKELTSSPVKILSQELNIPVIEADVLNSAIITQISKLRPDFIIVEDYGLILPKELLALPKFAPLNIHHSLLPKYRGPSPAPSAILAGDKVSGVTIIKMTEQVDAGDILAQVTYILEPDETTDSLLTKLNTLGGALMNGVIEQFLEGLSQPIKQDVNKVSYTKRFTKQDGYFDINNPPSKKILDRMIRAYFPWPNVWTRWNNKIVKFYPEGFVQLEGKNKVELHEFLNGYKDFPIHKL